VPCRWAGSCHHWDVALICTGGRCNLRWLYAAIRCSRQHHPLPPYYVLAWRLSYASFVCVRPLVYGWNNVCAWFSERRPSRVRSWLLRTVLRRLPPLTLAQQRRRCPACHRIVHSTCRGRERRKAQATYGSLYSERPLGPPPSPLPAVPTSRTAAGRLDARRRRWLPAGRWCRAAERAASVLPLPACVGVHCAVVGSWFCLPVAHAFTYPTLHTPLYRCRLCGLITTTAHDSTLAHAVPLWLRW